jgi:hypothetical protein
MQTRQRGERRRAIDAITIAALALAVLSGWLRSGWLRSAGPDPWAEPIAADPMQWGVGLLLPALLALALVLLVRPPQQPRRRTWHLSLGEAFVVGVLAYLFPLALLPLWWLYAVLWLRTPAGHGWLGRLHVWAALTLQVVATLATFGFFGANQVILAVAGFGPLLGFGMLARMHDYEESWRSIDSYLAFLVALLAIRGCALFYEPGTGFPILVVVSAGCYVVFLGHGRDKIVRSAVA